MLLTLRRASLHVADHSTSRMVWLAGATGLYCASFTTHAMHIVSVSVVVLAFATMFVARAQMTGERGALLVALPIMRGAGFEEDADAFFSNWTDSASVCEFAGVTCDSDGFVTELTLSACGLRGRLPAVLLELAACAP